MLHILTIVAWEITHACIQFTKYLNIHVQQGYLSKKEYIWLSYEVSVIFFSEKKKPLDFICASYT